MAFYKYFGEAEGTLRRSLMQQDGEYLLFEIPVYGGEPVFTKAYHTARVDDLVRAVELRT